MKNVVLILKDAGKHHQNTKITSLTVNY